VERLISLEIAHPSREGPLIATEIALPHDEVPRFRATSIDLIIAHDPRRRQSVVRLFGTARVE